MRLLVLFILLALLFVEWRACAAVLDIGSTVQLFTDDALIENMERTQRVLSPATKVKTSPILPLDRPWEGNNAFPRYVYYDVGKQQFQMWYMTNVVTSHIDKATNKLSVVWHPDRQYLCFATSKNGLDWEKPSLGLVEFEGSKDNNILPPGGIAAELYGFIRDEHAKYPKKRFVGLRRYMDRDLANVARAEEEIEAYYRVSDELIEGLKAKDNYQIVMWDLYFSPDGFDWTPCKDNPVIRNAPQAPEWAGPTGLMGWDPVREVYAVYMEPSQHARSTDFQRHGRLVGRAESKDLKEWGPPVTVMVPDDSDHPADQFYDPAFTMRHGLILGTVAIYRTNTGAIFPQFVCSRDAVHYTRDFRQPFIPVGQPGAFDSQEMYASAPIWAGDSVYFFYHGRNAGHMVGGVYAEPRGEDDLFGGIGLATTPKDRFVSLDAGNQAGLATTRTFTFEGNRLYVNAGGAHGMQVQVQILGPASHIVPGFEMGACDPIAADDVDCLVTWNGNADVGALAGKPVKLRFQLQNAQIFGFQFRDAE